MMLNKNTYTIDNAINTIINYQKSTQHEIKIMIDNNARLNKTIATIRSCLERTLKNPSGLNNAVYECINLCRDNFIYMDYTSGKMKKDPPLNDMEKTLP